MSSEATLTLAHEVEAVQIPYGNTLKLPAGIRVSIMQQLGDTFTVITESGYLVRIDGKDAGALGQSAPASAQPQNGELSEARVWDVLKSCYDPEIPVNIVDLGLIYKCETLPLTDGGHVIKVAMTLTAPGCGMGQVLKDDIERKLLALPGVREAQVEVVFEPPWDPSRMSEAARLQAGLM